MNSQKHSPLLAAELRPLALGRYPLPAKAGLARVGPARLVRRMAPIWAALGVAAALRAQTPAAGPAESAEPFVVTATRTPEDIRTLGSAVDLLTSDDLVRRQIETLADALGGIPGGPAFANGAPGSDVSVFLRGANSDQTLFLVDGIRFNDANTDYSVFLGGARLGAGDSVEVVRGPQSTLYGSEAVGGVVSLASPKGAGAPSFSFSAEAGTYGTIEGQVAAQGAQDGWMYSVSASGGHTDNARINNTFDNGNTAVRLDRPLNDAVTVGVTLRGFVGRYGDPGDMYTNDRYDYEKENNWLGTAFAELRLAPDWTARVTLGDQDRRYQAVAPDPGGPVSITTVKNRREVLDAQTTWTGLERQRITAGITGEDAATLNTGYGSIDQRQTLFAAFAQDEWNPVGAVHLTGGLRYDDFDTFGSETTGRATAAWLSPDSSVKARASYGTGFNAPSFLELYGTATGYKGNPNLRPERASGGDAGLDFYFPQQGGSFSATWFRTDYRDLIVYNFSVYPGTTANVDRARTDGVELEIRFALPNAFRFEASYTYLEADDLTDATRLLRRPRDSGSADLWRDFGGGFSGGVGVGAVGTRQDVDALTYLTVNDPSYAVFRVYAAWAVSRTVTVKARIENLLDRRYQPVNGYPALGAAAFAGVQWSL